MILLIWYEPSILYGLLWLLLLLFLLGYSLYRVAQWGEAVYVQPFWWQFDSMESKKSQQAIPDYHSTW